MKNKIPILLLLQTVLFFCSCSQSERINLAGEWAVKIDSTVHTATLPGSLAENRIGYPPIDSATNILSEAYTFQGPAWYEKEVKIPSSWEGHPVELYIERTKVSEVYINDRYLGSQNSVSTPHIYITDSLFKSGKNRIRIKVDNTKSLLPLGGSHAYSEHTQTNWNGILGDFYLRKLPEIAIKQMRVDTSADGNCSARLLITNYTKETYSNKKIKVNVKNPEGKIIARNEIVANIPMGISEQVIIIKISDPRLWDEYSPYLYTFTTEIPGIDKSTDKIGIRNFFAHGTRFTNNQRIVFLRGKNESGVFPLTGYPSMNSSDWKRYFTTIKSYGINHVRYHSWTPPRAAFKAADELGVFLQPELPLWGTYREVDTCLISYMTEEGHRIMREYGNHPSFVMFSLGNELEGDTAIMARIVRELKETDNRHLYALGTNNHYWNPQTHPLEDFFVAMRHGKAASDNNTDLRGSFSFADSDRGGIINCLSPNTMRSFASGKQKMNKPTIGHETGQYQVYPNFEEIDKYKGVLLPLNFMVFKKRLEQTGMGEKANAFLKASGALAALCYREEIEMSLRTPGFGGFQLLDLQDYPGQGTALVGILDAFLESKGVISKEEWSAFCNDVVPLACFSKYCWTTGEEFNADILIANYGQSDITGKTISCTLSSEDGKIIYSEETNDSIIPQGELYLLKKLIIPLNNILMPSKLSLQVSLKDTPYHNSWNIWVYPPNEKTKVTEGYFEGVTVTRDKNLFEKLYPTGKPVLYIPKEKDIKEKSVGGLFISDFWNYKGFKGVAKSLNIEPSPGTLGLLIENTEHEIFNGFPTDSHTNWQWWTIIKNSRPIILDNMPANYFPIVQVIDNFDRNHKLGLIYQLPGSKAVICSSDLFACRDEPEVKALFNSLVEYLKKIKKSIS